MAEESSEYLIKLAALKEFEAALEYKKSYEDMTHAFLGLFKEFTRYCERNKIEIPEKETYYRIIESTQALILSRVSSSEDKAVSTPKIKPYHPKWDSLANTPKKGHNHVAGAATSSGYLGACYISGDMISLCT